MTTSGLGGHGIAMVTSGADSGVVDVGGGGAVAAAADDSAALLAGGLNQLQLLRETSTWG